VFLKDVVRVATEVELLLLLLVVGGAAVRATNLVLADDKYVWILVLPPAVEDAEVFFLVDG
jgi:hypothetical protein